MSCSLMVLLWLGMSDEELGFVIQVEMRRWSSIQASLSGIDVENWPIQHDDPRAKGIALLEEVEGERNQARILHPRTHLKRKRKETQPMLNDTN